MRSKGDEYYRRLSNYSEHGRENDEVARLLADNYAGLSGLMTDDLSRECFQLTYLRITARYAGGDFMRQFRALFRATLREMQLAAASYRAKNCLFNDAISTEVEEAAVDTYEQEAPARKGV